MADGTKELVLVTGGTGFLGAWVIVKLLAANYRVRTTVRSLKREKDVIAMLKAADVSDTSHVSFVEANLTDDAGWAEAVKDCSYVMHLASPVVSANPKNEEEVIGPARDGTLRVLRAARDAKVKRVVVTSSIYAVTYIRKGVDPATPFTEEDWADANFHKVNAYNKSKTIAERAAWAFVEKEGNGLELSVVNPGYIYGPVLADDFAAPMAWMTRLLNGEMPGCPNVTLNVIDVRDVADLHLVAMTDSRAKGERFLCVQQPPLSIKDISMTLREGLGKSARRCPKMGVPDFLIKLNAFIDPGVALIVPQLSIVDQISGEKAIKVLDWKPKFTAKEAVIAAGESLIKYGVIKP